MATIEVEYLGCKGKSLSLPCSDSELGQRLESSKILITRVLHPEGLSLLKDALVNVDELNFLAKVMEGYDPDREAQFLAGVSISRDISMKDLINISLNTSHYTVIKDCSDLAAAGERHLKNLGHATLTMEPEEFVNAGKRLLASGRGVPTEYGLLFENTEVPILSLYDGRHLPWYWCRDEVVASIRMQYGDKTDYLYLPVEDATIHKALARLGCPDLSDCSLEIDKYSFRGERWKGHMDSVFEKEGLHGANQLAEAICLCWRRTNELLSVAEFAQAEGSEDIKRLAEHIDDFVVLKHAKSAEDVAKYFVTHEDGYRVDSYVREFVDFQRMGESIIANREGQFVGDGFVCMEKGKSLEQIMEDPSPGMELTM